MCFIELKQKFDTGKTFHLYLEGKELRGITIRKWNEKFQVSISTVDLSRKLFRCNIRHFPSTQTLKGRYDFDLFKPITNIRITIKMSDANNYDVAFTFVFDFIKWDYNFSFSNYLDGFLEEMKKNPNNISNVSIDGFSRNGFSFRFKNVQFEKSINDELESLSNFIKARHTSVLHKLIRSKSTIDLNFSFQEEIKNSCEQYLLYFAQFLRDLGINATSDLKEEAGNVLFSVTPTDDIEALDKIREALAVYLNLPSSPIVYDESFAAMRLQQQIENLQHSQKMAAREIQLAEKVIMIQSETIQEKNIIISQKDSTIEQQNKVIEKITSKSIMMDSVENQEELEKFCEGFEVGKSEFLIKYFGLHLNPATVLKSAGKKILGKGESESILNLGEETDKDN